MTVSEEESGPEEANFLTGWGPILFYAALIATLVFFWWLVIYDHGVQPHGGG